MHLATQADDIEAVESAGLDAHVPWTSVPQALEAVAARHGGRPALSWHVSADPAVPGECWTHAELMFRVRQTANLLRSHGVDDDHAVALLLPAVPAAYLALLGGEAARRVCPVNLLLDAAHCAALFPAVPKRLTLIDTMPMTAIGKVYKPALRVRAVEQALRERLLRAGLDARVLLRVDESPQGPHVCFTCVGDAGEAGMAKTSGGAGAAGGHAAVDRAAVERLMAPFAMRWRFGQAPA